MPSTVRPSDICSLVPNASDPACQSVKSIFKEIPALICDLVTYLFDASGNPSDDFLNDIGATISPPGTIIDYAGSSVPDGWLICNGQAVNRTTYAKLFSAIGTIWGSGDGTTTFNVPNLDKRVTIGRAAGYDVGSTGGVADGTIIDHKHGVGFFPEQSDDGSAFWTDGYTLQEDRNWRTTNGEFDNFTGSSETAGKEFPAGPNGNIDGDSDGIVTDLPIASTVTDGNMPPYAAVYKLIKT